MSAVVFGDVYRIPHSIRSLTAFRRWRRSRACPERGRFSYLDGDVWVDLDMEELLHNLLKSCVCTYLTLLATQEELGTFVGDRMLLTNARAKLSTEPDGMFLSHRSVEAKRVRLAKAAHSLEVLGSPDMVLEIVSPTSVRKDTKILPLLYWRAGILEYWLIDARQAVPELKILRRGKTRYRAVRAQDGWSKSSVFGKSFRLVGTEQRHGIPAYTLESK